MLNITDKIRIRKMDSRNVVVEIYVETKLRKGGTGHKWKLYGFYSSVAHALKGALNACLDYDLFYGDERVKNLDTALNELDNFKKELANKIKSFDKGCLNI